MRLTGVLTALTVAFALVLAAVAVKPAQAATENPVIANETTTWQYVDSGTRPADGWQTSEVVTGDWKNGTGSFGAKKGELAALGSDGAFTPKTLLTQYKEDGETDIPVYFFRTTFDVADVTKVKAITGSVDYDDAAIVAVNGVVVGEFDNHSYPETDPATPIYGTDNYGGSNKSAPLTGEVNFTDVAKLNLKAKGNVISVELHNARANSSDIYLDVKNLALTLGSDEQGNDKPSTVNVKNLLVNVGTDETHRNFNWFAESNNDSYVQYAAVDDNFKTGDKLPAEGVVTKKARHSNRPAYDKNYWFKVDEADGFEANKTYAYRVGNDTDGWTTTYTFKTLNQGRDASFKFLVAGDPQIGSSGNAWKDGHMWGISLDEAYAQNPDASLLLSVGDQADYWVGNNKEYQYERFADPDSLQHLPLATIVGNHDNGGSLYSAEYNMPNTSDTGKTAAGAYSGDYWFVYNGVLFMALNSNSNNLNAHKSFMENVLKSDAAKNVNWKVVTFHHAPFSVANHYSDGEIKNLRKNLTPIISELGIDVVLTGHDHHYTRSYMLDKNGNPSKDAEGKYTYEDGSNVPSAVTDPQKGDVLYMTFDSASGSKYYNLNGSLNGKEPAYSAMSWQQKQPTMTVVNVTKDSFSLEMYQTEDNNSQKPTYKKIDSFTIKRSQPVDKKGLNEAIETAKKVEQGNKTDEAWQKLQDAIADAQKVAADDKADQKAVDAAVAALNKAVETFNASDNKPKPANKDDLKAAVDAAGKVDLDRYYDGAEKDAFKKALESARLVLADGSLTTNDQAKVDAAAKALTDAQAALRRRPTSGGGNGGGTVTPPTTPTTPSGNKVEAPATANGSVTLDRQTAAEGETVTIAPRADEGYHVSSVKVTDEGGRAVAYAYRADGTFSFEMPEGAATVRVEFAGNEPRRFSDVDAPMWQAAGVDFVSSRGIMGGYANPDGTASGTFGVDDPLTRAQFAQLLYSHAQPGLGGSKPANGTGLPDVAGGQWYTAAANWAVASKVINGYAGPDGATFGPDDPVTLEQMVAIVANLKGADVSKADPSVLDRFVDGDAVSPWARQAVAWAVQEGLFSGSVEADGLHVRPTEPITRGRVASVLMNAFQRGILK